MACLAIVAIVGLTGIATAWASSSTEVQVIKTKLGHILGQQKGFTLYIYCTGASVVCSKGHTSSLWPPMIAYHKPVAGPGVNPKKLGTKKINGKSVVTYYGDPLYRYKGDTKPGQTNGEAKNHTWYAVTQFGQPQTPPGY
jgi:predicted lipoprotein with Yx(FWY)xxD motif